MSTNIPPTDINSVLQAQIASRERAKKVDKEENDRQRNRQEQLRAELQHSSQVEDPDELDPARPLRDEQRRQGRRDPRERQEELADPQQNPNGSDEYIPSEQARKEGLAGPDAAAAESPPAKEPPAPPKIQRHRLDLEA